MCDKKHHLPRREGTIRDIRGAKRDQAKKRLMFIKGGGGREEMTAMASMSLTTTTGFMKMITSPARRHGEEWGCAWVYV